MRPRTLLLFFFLPLAGGVWAYLGIEDLATGAAQPGAATMTAIGVLMVVVSAWTALSVWKCSRRRRAIEWITPPADPAGAGAARPSEPAVAEPSPESSADAERQTKCEG